MKPKPKPTPTPTPETDPTPTPETETERKIREARERFERTSAKILADSKRKVGTVGFAGRAPSIFDGIRSIVLSGSDTVTLKALTVESELAYRLAGTDRKVSKDGAKVYSGYSLNLLALFGLVTFDPTGKVYRLSPDLLTTIRSGSGKK